MTLAQYERDLPRLRKIAWMAARRVIRGERNRPDIEDIVQSVLLSIVKSLDKRDAATMHYYVRGAAHKAAVEFLYGTPRPTIVSLNTLYEESHSLEDVNADPLGILIRNEGIDRILRAYDTLAECEQIALVELLILRRRQKRVAVEHRVTDRTLRNWRQRAVASMEREYSVTRQEQA